jgi:uncharacterized protein with PIN domain
MKLDASRARDAISQPYFPRCERCNEVLTLPEWSEQMGPRCVRHLWACDICGYQFESWIYSAKDS